MAEGFFGEYLHYWQYVTNVVDLILVYLLIYRLLIWTKNTHTFTLIRGLFGLFVLFMGSQWLAFSTLNWILGSLTTVLVFILIIIFQPELRRFLENVGTMGNLFSPTLIQGDGQSTVVIRQLLKAIETLSKNKIGSLIVIEVGTDLSEFSESGVRIDAAISSDLLVSLFWAGTPTHDGAVIIRENRVESAGCLLPLTSTRLDDRRLGTRHRAGIGLSERADALIIIISEETGVVSIAEKGVLNRYLTKETIETRLFNLYKEESGTIKEPVNWVQKIQSLGLTKNEKAAKTAN